MAEPTFGFDGARTEEEIQRWSAGMAAKAERYQVMQQRVTGVTSSASSSDGVVSVVVDSAGAVRSLTFTDGVRAFTGDALTKAVAETMRRAQAGITGQVAEIMRETVGDDPATVEAVVSNYRQRFPEPEPEDAPRRTRRDDQDDDFGDYPFGR
ncbi:DNA-binding protein YbaB [Actinokineospora baliensis]|uniref:YbaB/EbfC family nucleoid-associated protein n=1 Tax=Actinokineospora baliensis TaxID=547056 RepID=UPI0019566171|nr:YbaB/EbfC family nucleoid-associated protein [Actinokineospora baliensis]MBM7774686.1 DNA-binding protein YbaB [Actinokineospora baliensis]